MILFLNNVNINIICLLYNDLSCTSSGVDAITNMDENYENQEKSEVVSAEELDIIHEEESCIQFAVEVQPDEEISDNIEFIGGEDSVEPLNVSEEVKQSEGMFHQIL